MKKLLVFLALLGFVGSAGATKVFIEEGNPLAVMLTDKPCVVESVTRFIEPAELKHFKSAAVKFGEDLFNACWREVPKEVEPSNPYFIVDEEGDAGFLEKDSFKEWDGKPGIFGTKI
jgi:hypothetical protein